MTVTTEEGGAPMPGTAGLISLLLSSLLPMLGLFVLGPALPKVAAAFADDPDAVLLTQMVGGASGVAFALSCPFMGHLIERWGYRNVYVGALLVFAVVGTLPIVLDSLALILATRVVLGVAVAGTVTSGVVGIGFLPDAIRPRMFGRSAVLGSVGSMICFPAVGALSQLGWHWPFLIHLLALLAVPLALSLPSGTRRPVEVSKPSGSGLGVSAYVLGMTAFIGLVMYVGPMFSPFYLRTIGITDPKLAALPLSCMSVGSILMSSNYGRLHGRFGSLILFAATWLFAGCGLLLAGTAVVLPVFMFAMFIVACGLSLFTPNLNAHIVATSHNTARGIGLAMSAMFVVQLAFPFVAREIVRAGSPASVFHFFGGASILIGLLLVIPGWRAYRLKERLKPQQAA